MEKVLCHRKEQINRVLTAEGVKLRVAAKCRIVITFLLDNGSDLVRETLVMNEIEETMAGII